MMTQMNDDTAALNEKCITACVRCRRDNNLLWLGNLIRSHRGPHNKSLNMLDAWLIWLLAATATGAAV